MDQEIVTIVIQKGIGLHQMEKGLPSCGHGGVVVIARWLELRASPIRTLSGDRIEIRGFQQAREVMVPEEREQTMFLNEIDACTGIGSVPDDVAEADDPIDHLLADVGEDNLEGFEIRVDVTDDGGSHDDPMVPARMKGSNAASGSNGNIDPRRPETGAKETSSSGQSN